MSTALSLTRPLRGIVGIVVCLVAMGTALSGCKKIGPGNDQAWAAFKAKYQCQGQNAGPSPYGNGAKIVWTCQGKTFTQHGEDSVPAPRELQRFEQMMEAASVQTPGPWLKPDSPTAPKSLATVAGSQAVAPKKNSASPAVVWKDSSQDSDNQDTSGGLLAAIAAGLLIGLGIFVYRLNQSQKRTALLSDFQQGFRQERGRRPTGSTVTPQQADTSPIDIRHTAYLPFTQTESNAGDNEGADSCSSSTDGDSDSDGGE